MSAPITFMQKITVSPSIRAGREIVLFVLPVSYAYEKVRFGKIIKAPLTARIPTGYVRVPITLCKNLVKILIFYCQNYEYQELA